MIFGAPGSVDAALPPRDGRATRRDDVMIFGLPGPASTSAAAPPLSPGLRQPGQQATFDAPSGSLRCPRCFERFPARIELAAGAVVQCPRCREWWAETALPPPPGPDWRFVGVQRFVAGLGAVVVQSVARPPGFLRVARAALVPGSDNRVAELHGELFLGVTALECVRAYTALGQRMPFDVWLAVARAVSVTLREVPSDDELWAHWSGPRSFGVTTDGRLVHFEGADGAPLRRLTSVEWTRAPAGTAPENFLARSVALALAWMLEGWATEGEREGAAWDGQLHHPQVDSETEGALLAAVSGASTLDELSARLAAVDRPVASPERVRDVFLGSTAALQARAGELRRRVRRWPPDWAGNGLAVVLDEALERGLPPSPAQDAAPLRLATGRPISLPVTGSLELLVERDHPAGRQLLWEGHCWWGSKLPARLEWPPQVRQPPAPGTRLAVTVRHPAHREVSVRLDAVQGADGHLRLTPPAQASALEALLASQAPTDEAVRLPPPGALAPGRWPWRATVVAAIPTALVAFASAQTAEGAGWYLAWLLLTLIAVGPASWLIMSWPFRRGASLALLLGGAAWLTSYARAEHDRAAGGLVPLLGLLGLGLLTRPRHRSSWFHAASLWRRALEEQGGFACVRCDRRHPPGAWYPVCQYASCRAPLRPGEGCRCRDCEEAEFRASASASQDDSINRDQ